MKGLKVFAPAKINLYLQVTGRKDNGYHTLDSLVSFVDIGDQITIERANSFSFHMTGPYASSFIEQEHSFDTTSENLVVQAAQSLAQLFDKELNFSITLLKNLPLASGIGGGSSDAAATVWALCCLWDIEPCLTQLLPVLTPLGADVPMCVFCAAHRVLGIGDVLEAAPYNEEISIVLVNPGKRCSTQEVFNRYTDDFQSIVKIPASFSDLDCYVEFLGQQDNVLLRPALEIVPEISIMLDILQKQSGCKLARMSGSGATCFALFCQKKQAQKAAEDIIRNHPSWWVRVGTLNGQERSYKAF